jgi:hypothetical protein
MPTPHYHHPQAHSHPGKSHNWLQVKHSECNKGPNASNWALDTPLFIHFFFCQLTNCFSGSKLQVLMQNQAMPMHGMDTQDDDDAMTTQDDTAPTPSPMSNCSQGGS